MFALLSPAKKLHEACAVTAVPFTEPALLDEAKILVETARKLNPKRLERTMGISAKLAALNHTRFQEWSPPFGAENARQAALLFAGDTYFGLDADTLAPDDLTWAQDHLGILSGLYGLLRPLDLMQPYRLEMGTRLKNPRGRTLYAFWGDRITQAINTRTEGHRHRAVINLASNEYASAVQQNQLAGAWITPSFREVKDGQPKMIGLLAKRARGAMARFMLTQRIETPDGLQAFEHAGYRFQPSLSDDTNPVFTRPWQEGRVAAENAARRERDQQPAA